MNANSPLAIHPTSSFPRGFPLSLKYSDWYSPDLPDTQLRITIITEELSEK
jgi:hypothetical protein